MLARELRHLLNEVLNFCRVEEIAICGLFSVWQNLGYCCMQDIEIAGASMGGL